MKIQQHDGVVVDAAVTAAGLRRSSARGRGVAGEREESRVKGAVTAASTTTPSCCWIFINLSFPLAGSRKRRRLPSRTCVERGGAVRSALVIGDLDHVEYDYIITVLLNASARDLQSGMYMHLP